MKLKFTAPYDFLVFIEIPEYFHSKTAIRFKWKKSILQSES